MPAHRQSRREEDAEVAAAMQRQEDYERHERELVPLTTRIPKDLFFELKLRALRSTIQILTEHAYTLYLGSRLPPDLWAGYEWVEEFSSAPMPAYLSSPLRGFSVRVPRSLLRWARVFAAQADISDQDLGVRVLDWYLRKGLIPPNREEVKRDDRGRLVVDMPLVADQFWGYSNRQIMHALDILVDRHTRFGGPLGSPNGDLTYDETGTRKLTDAEWRSEKRKYAKLWSVRQRQERTKDAAGSSGR